MKSLRSRPWKNGMRTLRDFLTVGGIVDLYDCSNQTVRNRVNAGMVRGVLKIPISRTGKKVVFLIPVAEARRLFSNGKVKLGRPRKLGG